MNAFNPEAPATPAPNKADILAHLTALFPPDFVHPYPDALIEIAYGTPGNIDRAELFSAFKLDAAAAFAETKNLHGCNVYVGPTLKKPGTAPFARTNDGDFLAGTWAWSDQDAAGDFERAKSAAKKHNLSPGMIVDTGTVPHVRAHCYFKIAGSVTETETMRAINKALIKCVGGDSVQAPSHAMRLAGMVNYPTPAKFARGYVIEPVTLRVERAPHKHPPEILLGLHPSGADGGRKKSGLGFDIPRDDDELLELLKATRTPGKWHVNMRGAIATMVGRGWSDSAICLVCAPYCTGGASDPDLTPLIEGARAKWDKPNSEQEQASAGQDEPQAERPPAFTDEALALRFASTHTENLRYVASASRWFIYDGKQWQIDDTLRAFDMVRRVCRQASMECNKGKVASALASAKTVAAVERLAKSDRRLAATMNQWDADPMILNTPAGVIDLRVGQLRAHQAEDYLTRSTSVGPAGTACPTWLTFLDRITGSDMALQEYLQRATGYALTGLTIEHALFFLYGLGANGKSVFINTIAGILDTYHRTSPIETFTATNTDRHPTDLAGLRGARLVTAVETEEGRRWAESKIKSLTGGDEISARFMRGDFFEFRPQFKLMIAGNHKPSLRSVDEAIRRRFNLVPFSVRIPPHERDERLTEKLKQEWPGILAWMIAGCLEWQRIGLQPPAVVTEATAEYLAAEDALTSWIEDKCERNPQSWTSSTDLFVSWTNWANVAGEPAGAQKGFVQKLEDRGFQKERNKVARGFRGIRIQSSDYVSRY